MSYDWESRDYILLNREGSTNLPAVPSSDMQGQLFVDRDAGPPDLLKLVRLNAAGSGYEYAVLNRPLVAGSSNIVVTNGDAVAGNPTVDLGSDLTASGFFRYGGGGSPTYTTLTAMGTTAAVNSSAGGSWHGELAFTPGGTGIASGTQAQINFGATLANTNYDLILVPRNAAAGGILWYTVTRGLSAVSFGSTTALVSGTLYALSYIILGR